MNNAEIIKQLQDELEQTKLELNLTKEHLKKYTNNNCVFVSFFFPVGVRFKSIKLSIINCTALLDLYVFEGPTCSGVNIKQVYSSSESSSALFKPVLSSIRKSR